MLSLGSPAAGVCAGFAWLAFAVVCAGFS